MNTTDFIQVVEWSEPDEAYVGSLLPHIGQCCHGNTEAEVYHQLRTIAEDVVESCNRGDFFLPSTPKRREYSGNFEVRIDPTLHKVASIMAMRERKSLNAFVATAIEQAVAMR